MVGGANEDGQGRERWRRLGEGWDIKAAKTSDIQEGIAKGCLVSSCLVQSTVPLFRGRGALLPVSPIRLPIQRPTLHCISRLSLNTRARLATNIFLSVLEVVCLSRVGYRDDQSRKVSNLFFPSRVL